MMLLFRSLSIDQVSRHWPLRQMRCWYDQSKTKNRIPGEVHKCREAAKVKRVTLAQSGRIPRIAKLVAPASRMQTMIDSGEVESFQQLAELGRISQPRMTQIMSLLNLAPDIQEELLYLGSNAGESADP